jgi:hypothetical protein
MDGEIASDEALLEWMANPSKSQILTWQKSGLLLTVSHIATENVATHFGFVQKPAKHS